MNIELMQERRQAYIEGIRQDLKFLNHMVDMLENGECFNMHNRTQMDRTTRMANDRMKEVNQINKDISGE